MMEHSKKLGASSRDFVLLIFDAPDSSILFSYQILLINLLGVKSFPNMNSQKKEALTGEKMVAWK
jgi:hypothetical protein